MIRITAQINNEALRSLPDRQVPFATSLAINRTAAGARDVVRGNLPKRFRLRNQWTVRGVQARMSTKSRLSAQIVAPDYMAIQETGGTRHPERSVLLAAPSQALQASKGVIPKGKRPRALLADRAFILDMGGGDAGVFLRYGRKRGQIKLMWWLGEEQQYDDRFKFEADIRDHVQDRFSAEFVKAMNQALAGSR